MLACDISQKELADGVAAIVGRPISRPTINLCVNKGYIPTTIRGFKAAVEQVLQSDPLVEGWLQENKLSIAAIWQPSSHLETKQHHPSGLSRRTRHGVAAAKAHLNNLLGDPTSIEGDNKMLEMLHPEAMRKHRLFRHPFLNDVTCEKDIYMSDEHRYIESAMMDAARHCGFMAVIGEVQGGKSTIRKKVVENLLRDQNVTIIYPRNHKINMEGKAQSRISATSLCDAIIMDISGETPKIKTEQKVRQLESLLIKRANQNNKHVLIIEEAQNLTTVAFKYLKQFYELEDGFKKLLSIIILGQPELMDLLDERKHPELREVSQRIQVAEIRGLNGDLRNYLTFKFKRVGAKIEDIFDDSAFDVLSRRLASTDERGRKVSCAYPGLVNLYTVRAINYAHEMGFEKVTAEVVEAI